MAKQASSASYIVKLLIGLFFIFGFGLVCPPWGGITQVGMTAIGIFLGVVFLIVTGYGLIMPSLVGMFALLLTGYYTSNQLIAATTGSSTVFQLILVYALCEAVVACGAGEVMAKWLITRKVFQGRPLLWTVVFLMACVIAGALVGIGGVIFTYTILESVRQALGYEMDSKWNKYMSLGLYTAACAGMSIIPFKGVPLIIFGSVESQMVAAGLPVNYGTFMLTSLIISVAYVVVFTFMMKFIFKVDMDALRSFDATKIEGMQNVKMNRQQAWVSVLFLLSMLYSVVIIFLTAEMKASGIGKLFASIGQPMWFALFLGLMCVVRVEGKPIINAEKCFKDGMSWGVVLAVCVFSVLGAVISSDSEGIKAWLVTLLNPVFGNMAFPMFMFLLVALTLVITNFFSNTAIGLIMSSLTCPFVAIYANEIGISPSVVGSALVMASMFAFLTMAASGTSPLFLGRPCIEKDSKFVYTSGIVMAAVMIVITTVCGTLLAFVL